MLTTTTRNNKAGAAGTHPQVVAADPVIVSTILGAVGEECTVWPDRKRCSGAQQK